jgi:hypothetical protein
MQTRLVTVLPWEFSNQHKIGGGEQMHSGQCSEHRGSVATPRFKVREFSGTCDLKRNASIAQNRSLHGTWANNVGTPRHASSSDDHLESGQEQWQHFWIFFGRQVLASELLHEFPTSVNGCPKTTFRRGVHLTTGQMGDCRMGTQ